MAEQECTGPFRVGDTILHDYKVMGLLGAGGHAFVYESKDPYLGTPVAIKVIQKPPGGSDLVSRGRAEAKVLTELQHPNVVRVHLARPLGNSMICIVMEKLEGLTLRQLLQLHRRLTITETLRIVRQIADALSAAHKMNVIHRDVKPANIFILPPDNKVKVLDFGIAKFAGLGLTTNKFRFHGTPIYMAPEHLRDGTVTVRSDIFQLMIVAFEMITGVNPSLVDCENPNYEAVAFRRLQKPTPSLSSMIPDAPESVEYLIQKGTANDPRQRYGSMDELIVAIDKVLTERAGTHPQEAKSIRYVNEAAILAVAELDSEHDPWAEEKDPVESADTEAAAPPTFTAAAPRRASLGLDSSDPLAAVPRAIRQTATASLAAGFLAAASRRPTALAPTIEISREPPVYNNAAPTARVPAPTKTNPIPAPAETVSVHAPQTNDAYTTSASSHPPRRITATLLASAALVGGVLGIGISWPSIQQAREKHLEPAAATRAPNTPAMAIAPSIASPLPVVHRIPEEPSANPAPTAATVPVARTAAVAQPSKPTKAAAKPRSTSDELLFVSKDDDAPAKPQKPTKEEIARMQARLREFNADMAREAREKKAREAKP